MKEVHNTMLICLTQIDRQMSLSYDPFYENWVVRGKAAIWDRGIIKGGHYYADTPEEAVTKAFDALTELGEDQCVWLPGSPYGGNKPDRYYIWYFGNFMEIVRPNLDHLVH